MPTGIQLVFDCADPDRMADFWAQALGYRLQSPPDGFASWDAFLASIGIPEEQRHDASAIVDPDGLRPRVFFQKVPERKIAKNRLHIDVNAGAGTTDHAERRQRVDAEVARLKALGATDERGAIERSGGEYWVRMNDPEGNEFCVQ
jgi:catechol 2,3-dioxygenase-like lactoylglutathione lyase family enzyme